MVFNIAESISHLINNNGVIIIAAESCGVLTPSVYGSRGVHCHAKGQSTGFVSL